MFFKRFSNAVAPDNHSPKQRSARGKRRRRAESQDRVRRRLQLEQMEPRIVLSGSEIVFVDPSVWDQNSLPPGFSDAGREVVVLDRNSDGIQQMADYLNGRSGVDAIHLLSHGDIGAVSPVGNAVLSGANLSSYTTQLATIGSALTADGDILLWGCGVAGDEGVGFVQALADATGADVAASVDTTGSPTLGGDWDLEFTTGAIEATNFLATADPQITLSHFRGGSVTHTVSASGVVTLDVYSLWRSTSVDNAAFSLYSGPSQSGTWYGALARPATPMLTRARNWAAKASWSNVKHFRRRFRGLALTTPPGTRVAEFPGSLTRPGAPGNWKPRSSGTVSTHRPVPRCLPATIDIVAKGYGYTQNLNKYRSRRHTAQLWVSPGTVPTPTTARLHRLPASTWIRWATSAFLPRNTGSLTLGRWVYKVRVTDGQGAYADRDVMVVVENPNNTTDPNPGDAVVGSHRFQSRARWVGALTFNVTGRDTGSGQRPVTVRAQLLPSGATFPEVSTGTTSTSTFTWTPSPGDEGVYFVNFETFDDESVPIIDGELVQITVTGANDPPVLNSVGNKTVANGGTVSFTINGSDPNGDSLSYNAFFLPSGASFNSATRQFSWTPSACAIQQHIYKYRLPRHR